MVVVYSIRLKHNFCQQFITSYVASVLSSWFCADIRPRLGTHYPCSRAVLVIRAIPGVLQEENNYDVFIINSPWILLLCSHNPCSRSAWTGRVHG